MDVTRVKVTKLNEKDVLRSLSKYVCREFNMQVENPDIHYKSEIVEINCLLLGLREDSTGTGINIATAGGKDGSVMGFDILYGSWIEFTEDVIIFGKGNMTMTLDFID